MTTTNSARLSDCGTYRYSLDRRWAQDSSVKSAVFVMLNPSTADANIDDPTIRRCIDFARSFGCGALHVVNLYAYRATNPAELWQCADPVGPENDAVLRSSFADAASKGWPVVAAWGANARPGRARAVADLADSAGVPLTALKVTKSGQPGHPLYVRGDTRPLPFRLAR